MNAKKYTVFPTIEHGNMGLGEATTETGALRILRKEMGDKVKGVRFGWDKEPGTTERGFVNRFGWHAVK